MIPKRPLICQACGTVVWEDTPMHMVIEHDVKCPNCRHVVLQAHGGIWHDSSGWSKKSDDNDIFNPPMWNANT